MYQYDASEMYVECVKSALTPPNIKSAFLTVGFFPPLKYHEWRQGSGKDIKLLRFLKFF